MKPAHAMPALIMVIFWLVNQLEIDDITRQAFKNLQRNSLIPMLLRHSPALHFGRTNFAHLRNVVAQHVFNAHFQSCSGTRTALARSAHL